MEESFRPRHHGEDDDVAYVVEIKGIETRDQERIIKKDVKNQVLN